MATRWILPPEPSLACKHCHTRMEVVRRSESDQQDLMRCPQCGAQAEVDHRRGR